MRSTLKVLSILAFAGTVLILIPYIGLGPGGEYSSAGPDWTGYVIQGLLIVLVGFGSAFLLRRGATHLGRRGDRSDDDDQT